MFFFTRYLREGNDGHNDIKPISFLSYYAPVNGFLLNVTMNKINKKDKTSLFKLCFVLPAPLSREAKGQGRGGGAERDKASKIGRCLNALFCTQLSRCRS